MIDAITRHQLLVQRHYKGIYEDIKPIIEKMRRSVVRKIKSATEKDLDRLTTLLAEIDAIIKINTQELSKQMIQPLLDFYEYEAGFTQKLLDTSTIDSVVIVGTGLATEQIVSSITTKPMVLMGEEITIGSMISKYAGAVSRDVATAIRAGIIEGKPVSEIAYGIDNMTATRTMSQAEAVILTASNHIGAQARNDVWTANKHLFSGEEYVATLDSKTTIGCAALDGKIFPFGAGPHPPRHFRCRSFRTPIIKPEYDIPMENKRQSIDGPVSAKTTYSSWLKRQPAAFQDEVLGVERGKLFRKGEFELGDFVDKSGKTYTLDQLKFLTH